jgi:hypothetical protein
LKSRKREGHGRRGNDDRRTSPTDPHEVEMDFGSSRVPPRASNTTQRSCAVLSRSRGDGFQWRRGTRHRAPPHGWRRRQRARGREAARAMGAWERAAGVSRAGLGASRRRLGRRRRHLPGRWHAQPGRSVRRAVASARLPMSPLLCPSLILLRLALDLYFLCFFQRPAAMQDPHRTRPYTRSRGTSAHIERNFE